MYFDKINLKLNKLVFRAKISKGTEPMIFCLSIAGGSHHTYDTRIGYSGSDKNISYALNASKRHTGDYLPNAENDKLYFDGKIKFKTSDRSSLVLSGYYSDMDSEISNSVDPRTGKILTTNINWSLARSVPRRYQKKKQDQQLALQGV